MLTEQTIIDKIEIIGQFNAVQIREKIDVYNDDEFLYQKPETHRRVIMPDDDYSEESEIVKGICAALQEALKRSEVLESNQA